MAKAGWDIVVYSADPTFIEADVVRGYALEGSSPSSIRVHTLLDEPSFAELTSHPDLFVVRPDPARDWEVSFYRTLMDCDGVLLMGGGPSTLVTGLIALALRIPVLPIAAFGGNTRTIWERLANEHCYATEDDIAYMASGWHAGCAARLVAALQRQMDARATELREQERKASRESLRAIVGVVSAAVLLLAAVAFLLLSWNWRPGTKSSVAFLALAPVLTGAGGALIRTSLDGARDRIRAGILGGAAGLMTGLLYLVSQALGSPSIFDATADKDALRRLLIFMLPLGFVAGLTFDAVFAKLRKVDVSQSTALEQ
ncbi:MAG TPA: hypothetical protein VJ851_07475 [Jatrophihabitans sp.]|nr:hypothetical protein [Jatrophihabitans sp.]